MAGFLLRRFIFNFSLNHKLKFDATFMKLFDMVGRFKATDAGRLRAEYNRLVEGLAQRGNLPCMWIALTLIFILKTQEFFFFFF